MPASVRCTPSTRMSLTTNGSMRRAMRGGAERERSAASDSAAAKHACGSVRMAAARLREALPAATQNRRERSLKSASAINTASMAMPMRWPTSKARSETGLPLMISAK